MLTNFIRTNKQATSVGAKHLNTLEGLVARCHQRPLCSIGIAISQIYHFSVAVSGFAKMRAEHSLK